MQVHHDELKDLDLNYSKITWNSANTAPRFNCLKIKINRKIMNFFSFPIYSGLIKVQQELFHLHPTYKILSARDGDSDRELAVIKKKFSFLHHKFDIDSAYGQYSLEGEDIFAHSFALRNAGVTVASVSKKFISLSDTYGVEIASDQDQAFILALTIVLDQVLYDNDSHHHH
ncbi:unnamed protein product [Rotaria magnacalcarata]|uniref:Uncharacterized protein n=1 Tax=Rotaria magnacalcarata TaxID=392030 RepID=A0A819RI52_9BILA|nr:unnamed protein product [Rotaria magnacalcarata]